MSGWTVASAGAAVAADAKAVTPTTAAAATLAKRTVSWRMTPPDCQIESSRSDSPAGWLCRRESRMNPDSGLASAARDTQEGDQTPGWVGSLAVYQSSPPQRHRATHLGIRALRYRRRDPRPARRHPDDSSPPASTTSSVRADVAGP